MLQFDYLLMEGKGRYSSEVKTYEKAFDVVESVSGFSHIALAATELTHPIKIKTKPMIVILKRRGTLELEKKEVEKVSEEQFEGNL